MRGGQYRDDERGDASDEDQISTSRSTDAAVEPTETSTRPVAR